MKCKQLITGLLTCYLIFLSESSFSQCPTPTNVSVNYLTPSSATVVFNGQIVGSVYEYGPAGFIPGTGATAGGGTLALNPNLTGLNSGTNYHLYVRTNCNGVWTPNSAYKSFFTPFCPVSYYGTLGSILSINLSGNQLWDNHSCGPSYGKEIIVKFTPTITGTFLLQKTEHIIPTPFLTGIGCTSYRATNNICDLNGFNSPLQYLGLSGTTESFSVGPLNAGTTYDFLFLPIDSNTTGSVDIQFSCMSASGLSVSGIQSNSAIANFTCSCPNPVYLEYGPLGFNPGIDSIAGGGTLISNAISPVPINGLTANTNYTIYIRSRCGNTFTSNIRIDFKTTNDCATSPIVGCDSVITIPLNAFNGTGTWAGTCSGVSGSGPEKLYRFTPTVTGIYRLNNFSGSSANPIGASYKALGSCDANGWTCIGIFDQAPGALTFGPLTANTTYLLLFDAASNVSGIAKSIRLECATNCTASFTPSSSFTICNGSSATLQANTGTGITYQWYQNGSPIAGATSSSYQVTSAGWYSLIENTPCGLVSADEIYVSVRTSITPAIYTSTPTNFCAPGTLTMSAGRIDYFGYQNFLGATYQWQNNGVNISGATQSVYQTNTTGSYRALVSLSGCTPQFTNTITTTVANSVSAAITVTGSRTFCNGDVVKLSAIYIPGYTYQWKLNGSNISGATTDIYNATVSGSYTCTVTASCGTATSSPVIVTVLASPSANITANGSTNLCNGSVDLISPSASNTSYQWMRNGIKINGAINNIYTATLAGSYTCVVTNSCASISTNTIVVTGGSAPTVTAPSGTTGFCRPSTGNIYTTPFQSGLSYNWTIPNGATITNGQGTNSITVSFAANAISGNICVIGSNACGTSSSLCKQITVRSAIPSTPGTITGSNNGCTSESKIYRIRKLSTSDSYLWTPPIGATINGSSSAFATTDTFVTVTYTAAFTGDTLRVRGVNCRGNSAERKLRINHNAPSTPGTISGLNVGLCNQSNVSYSINAVSNATSYTWRSTIAGITFNGNASPYTTSATSVTVNFGTFTSGQIFVKANNGCGSGNERSLTVNAKPAVPTIINGPVSVCDGQLGVAYSTSAVTNASAYNWTVPSGATVASGQNTTNITVNFGATPSTGNVRVRSQNVCASSAYFTKSVTINNCPRLSTNSDSELRIHPNPFSEITQITLPDLADLKLCTINIYDVNGKPVSTIKNLQSKTIEFKKNHLPSGLYFIQLNSERGIISSQKLIIQ